MVRSVWLLVSIKILVFLDESPCEVEYIYMHDVLDGLLCFRSKQAGVYLHWSWCLVV